MSRARKRREEKEQEKQPPFYAILLLPLLGLRNFEFTCYHKRQPRITLRARN